MADNNNSSSSSSSSSSAPPNMSYSTRNAHRRSAPPVRNNPLAPTLSLGEQLNLATQDGMTYGNPLAQRTYEPRQRNPAFQDPAVKRVLSRLHTRLEEASRRIGDINKDVHTYITIPLFSMTNLGSVAQIRNLWDGGKSFTRRDGTTKQYPSSQYGWFQNFITHYIVYDLIRRNLGQIVSQTQLQRKQPIANLKIFRMKFSKEVRIWWATNSNRLLPVYALHVKNQGLGFIAANPIIREAFVAANSAKGAGQSVSTFLTPLKNSQLQNAVISFNAPITNDLPPNQGIPTGEGYTTVDPNGFNQ